MTSGRWSVVSGQWSVASGQSLVAGAWQLIAGRLIVTRIGARQCEIGSQVQSNANVKVAFVAATAAGPPVRDTLHPRQEEG
jgi:hypothetical protein